MDTFVELPYGGPGAGFCVNELIDHIRSTGRDCIIQGQQHCMRANHTKPQSLDVWLREGFTHHKDVAQAVNQVVKALVATGRFEIAYLPCPDSGRRCKGLRLLSPSWCRQAIGSRAPGEAPVPNAATLGISGGDIMENEASG